jgi:hypothetical protein
VDSGTEVKRQVVAAANSPNLLREWPLRAEVLPGAPSRLLPKPRRGRSGRSPIHGLRLLARRASQAAGHCCWLSQLGH